MWKGLLPALKETTLATMKTVDKSSILFAAGAVGVVGTGVCSSKAAVEAHRRSVEIEFDSYHSDFDERERVSYCRKRMVTEVAPLYAPAAVCGVLAIACFGLSNRHLAMKAATSAALAGTLERALESYSEKTLEVAGEEVHNKIQQAIADDIPDEILETAREDPESVEVINLYPHGAHDVLWYDCVMDKMFWATEAKIKDAESRVNQLIISEQVATVSDFYDFLHLESEGSASRALGWSQLDSRVNCMDITIGSKMDPVTHIPMNSISYEWMVMYPHEGVR